MNPKINTVIFDIGRVLVSFDWKSFLKQFHFNEKLEEEIGNAIFLDPLWNERDRGSIPDEENTLLYYKKYPHLKNEMAQVFAKTNEIVKEYDFSADWIRSLKNRGYRVLLLSNYAKTSFEYAFEHFNSLKLADGGVISYQVKSCKPEPEIYEALINRYEVTPETSVFLDDTLANLETARKFGFHTILVKDHESAKKALEEILSES